MHSLSPFQQTVLEQDEMFFQTFPDARSDRPPASLLPLHPAYSSLAQALDPCFLPLPSCPPPVPRSLSRHPPRHPRPCPSPYPRPKDPAWSPFSPNVAGTFVNVMGGSMGGPAVPPDLTGSRPVSISGKRSPDKKPALACVFCRGRKIACGPPTKDGDGRSCNQCQRRSLRCEYPTESRRGMRKKPVGAPAAAAASKARRSDAGSKPNPTTTTKKR